MSMVTKPIWFHSTVVTTSIPLSPPRDNIPDLTTIYTPPAYCVGRWMLPISNGSYGTTVFSTRPKASERGADSLYMGCQRFSTLWYSPGVCPHGQTVAEITEIRTSEATHGAGTFWRASCCMRFAIRFFYLRRQCADGRC